MEQTPLDIAPEQFRRLGAQVIALIADYLDGIDRRPVYPPITAAACEALFTGAPPPETGEAPDDILRDFEQRILPHLATLGSPRHFGYVIGSGTQMGVLADALAAGVNANTAGWKLGPAATEVERQTIRWLGELFGYPSRGGLFTSGGSMANLTALRTALCARAGEAFREHGLQTGSGGRFLLYMADHEGHSTVVRAAELLGLGSAAVRRVPSRADFTLDPAALTRMMDEDIARGDVPFCVVAQVGSVNVGAIDPLEELAEVCAARQVWLHGDGACGAPYLMLPELRGAFRGVERLDSLSFDPHKALSVPYAAGCLLVRDPERLRSAFSMHAAYLHGTLETAYQGLDFFDFGPELSRPFRALKVWMTLRQVGADGYRRVLRKKLELVRHLDARVRQHPDFVALHQPQLYLYSFQFRPSALEGQEAQHAQRLDRLNQELAEEIQQSGHASVMTTQIHGRTVLRLSVCSHRTGQEDIDSTFEMLETHGRRLAARL